MSARPHTVELDLPFAGVLPDRLRPMLPMPAAAPFDSPEYAFDVAWDGTRALAWIDSGEARLWGRDLADLTDRYPEIQALGRLAPPQTIVDGELIVSDRDGRPDAAALEARQRAEGAQAVAQAAAGHPVTYVVYDLLYLRGRSMLREPLQRRRARLNQSIPSSGRIYVLEPVVADGLAFFDAAREKGLMGVVAKRLESPYRPGQRHPDWLQIDAVRRQDFVIVGFTPQGGDHLIEALIVGVYDGRKFSPVGRVVGGFDPPTSRRLRKLLDGLPAAPEPEGAQWADDRVCWITPRLVIGIKFSEWDRQGLLRFPIFDGLRLEIAPEECVRTPMIEPPEPARRRSLEIQLPRLPI
jgi:bifunctional non-homologous end joining protein LigD